MSPQGRVFSKLMEELIFVCIILRPRREVAVDVKIGIAIKIRDRHNTPLGHAERRQYSEPNARVIGGASFVRLTFASGA
jgi:hypothetical protein